MELLIDTRTMEGYQTFLKIKALPTYSIRGRLATIPDEYAENLGIKTRTKNVSIDIPDCFFDYQAAISKWSFKKRKTAIFADCGLGKTLILLQLAKSAGEELGNRKGALIISPLMVVNQTIAECEQFFPGMALERVNSSDLPNWLKNCGGKIGITNYDALKQDLSQGPLGALLLDESSMLKSHYGKYSSTCIELGRGLEFKWCFTGTPAPNDRIEYANHAIFLDKFPTVNAFLATFFVNRGQTDNRWELKPHALKPFYRALSDWSIFLTNPATYGWKDNTQSIPPIHIHHHDVELTEQQKALVQKLTGKLVATKSGGITSRRKLGQIAKGIWDKKPIETHKPAYIRDLVGSWNESTICWCIYNQEQDALAGILPDSANIDGSTKIADRLAMIADFKAGNVKTLITKPEILGFGLNLQVATRQVFSGLEDSYEKFYQAVKRSNRYGSTKPLNVHLPATEIERAMVDNVLSKAARVQADAEEQERIFKDCSYGF